MAVLTIVRMGHPSLARPAARIEDPTAQSQLVADMTETLAASGGIGLAAPQINVGLQLVILSVPGSRCEDGRGMALTCLINPEIEPLSQQQVDGYEACLSVPGLTGIVPRWQHIYYRAQGLDGALIEGEAKGYHARVLQHECDHLWGRLYLSRMRDLETLAFRDELLRNMAEEEA